MKIVVLDGYTLNPGDNRWSDVEALGDLTVYERTDPEEVVARASDAQIILLNKTLLPVETLSRLPDLRFISVLATGYNIVDIAAAGARGIPVSNVPEYGTDSVAAILGAIYRVESETDGMPEQEALSKRREIIGEIDDKRIIATPANSSSNELVIEAARLSILNDGLPARIIYGDSPHVELR